ncbi:MAG: glutathione S-transferase family protein [Hahellaceae bacterium]|nr:glutathione S-transferase family protein [Hahellaceae bacterium]MCP5211544.1 glutathione S-transferase family protein [Hahellaceae bacterium]
MITIYGAPNTRTLRALWLLEEVGATYQYRALDFSKGESQSAEFLAINPAGKVPVMVDGDLTLTESAAILTHLCDKLSYGNLIPKINTNERSRLNEVCYFTMTELEQPLWLMAKHKFALPKSKRVADIFDTAQWEYQKACQLLSQKLGDKPYVIGASFTMADILVSQTLIWGQIFKLPPTQDNLQQYLQNIANRPALHAARRRETTS